MDTELAGGGGLVALVVLECGIDQLALKLIGDLFQVDWCAEIGPLDYRGVGLW